MESCAIVVYLRYYVYIHAFAFFCECFFQRFLNVPFASKLQRLRLHAWHFDRCFPLNQYGVSLFWLHPTYEEFFSPRVSWARHTLIT